MRQDANAQGADRDGFERYTASLIVVAGGDTGEEHVLARPRWLVGRGPDVDSAFDDPEMSQRHVAIEFRRGRFHAIDLESTNGTRVNGTGIAASELCHGDHIQVGAHVFQFLIEESDAPRASSARGDAVLRVG